MFKTIEGAAECEIQSVTWSSPKNLEDGIYTAMSERDRRIGEWNNRRQWSVEVGRRRQTL